MKINNKQLIQVGVSVVILVVLVVFVTSASKAIRRMFGFGEEQQDLPETPLAGDQPIPLDFDPLPLTTRLYEVLNSWLLDASPRCKAYKQMMELTDNEFIMVCNAYYNNYGRSLRSDMDATLQSGCTVFWTQWNNRVRRRMDELKVVG
ncbi:hypothetical protein [Phaeodactylibacter xiamenensis]|uniref:hypothetical protein n=1 Tax=Phaeodactylibacter xiamenensis TaxID=1524460 RepID=UPI0024A93AFC|nr:hypothetical protein [Phaeodactylibacter xiamenensis]